MIRNKKTAFLAFILLLTILPLLVLVIKQSTQTRSSAAAADQLEAEDGVLAGNATKQTDVNASGGSFVSLNKNQTPTPTQNNPISGVGWKGSTGLIDYPVTDTTTCSADCQIVDLDITNTSNGNNVTPLSRFNYALSLMSTKSRILLRNVNGGANAITIIPLTSAINRTMNWNSLLETEKTGTYKQFITYGNQRIKLDSSAVTLTSEGPLILSGSREHWAGFEITNSNLPPIGSGVTGIVTIRGSNNKIENFLIHNNAGGASTYVYGSNNIVQDLVAWQNGPNTGAINTHHPDGVNGAGNNDIWVRSIVFYGRDDGFDFYDCTNCKIIDSVSYKAGYFPGTTTPSGDGSGFKMGLTGPTTGNNQCIGCLSIDPYWYGFSLDETGPYPIIYNHVTTTGGTTGSFKARGNLNPNGTDVIGYSIYTNRIVSYTGTPALANNYAGSNPIFCNPTNGDYSLCNNSPGIGSGPNGSNLGASETALQLLKTYWNLH